MPSFVTRETVNNLAQEVQAVADSLETKLHGSTRGFRAKYNEAKGYIDRLRDALKNYKKRSKLPARISGNLKNRVVFASHQDHDFESYTDILVNMLLNHYFPPGNDYRIGPGWAYRKPNQNEEYSHIAGAWSYVVEPGSLVKGTESSDSEQEDSEELEASEGIEQDEEGNLDVAFKEDDFEEEIPISIRREEEPLESTPYSRSLRSTVPTHPRDLPSRVPLKLDTYEDKLVELSGYRRPDSRYL